MHYYTNVRRPIFDGQQLLPVGSLIESEDELIGDNFQPVDRNGNPNGPIKVRRLTVAAPAPAPAPAPTVLAETVEEEGAAAFRVVRAAPDPAQPTSTPIPTPVVHPGGQSLASAAAAEGFVPPKPPNPDGNNDSQRDTLESLTKAQLGEKLDALKLTPADAGYETWHEPNRSPTKKELIALALGETTVDKVKADREEADRKAKAAEEAKAAAKAKKAGG